MRSNNLKPALDDFKHALEIDPQSIRAHESIALLYSRVGNNEEAEKHFQTALSLASNDSNLHHNYGTFLCSQGYYKVADVEFNKAISNPFYQKIDRTYTNAGQCAQKQNATKKAEDYYLKALRANPKSLLALKEMAKINFIKNNYDMADSYIDRFRRVAQIDPKTAWLGYRVAEKLGKNSKLESFRVILKERYPDTKETQQLLEYEGQKKMVTN